MMSRTKTFVRYVVKRESVKAEESMWQDPRRTGRVSRFLFWLSAVTRDTQSMRREHVLVTAKLTLENVQLRYTPEVRWFY